MNSGWLLLSEPARISLRRQLASVSMSDKLTMRLFIVFFVLGVAGIGYTAVAQRDPGVNGRSSGGHQVYGDVSIEGDRASGNKPITLDLILYTEDRTIVARDTVSGN